MCRQRGAPSFTSSYFLLILNIDTIAIDVFDFFFACRILVASVIASRESYTHMITKRYK